MTSNDRIIYVEEPSKKKKKNKKKKNQVTLKIN